MKPDKWQEEILEYDGNILLNTGRQVGKTTVFAEKAARYMLDRKGSHIIVVSLTEDQAQLIIIMTLTALETLDKAKIAKGKKKPTKNRIQLKNGSQILARPVGNTGDAVRGFTADVLIVDEASRMPEDMWTAAKPTLATTGGQIWMCSTPFGKQGYFYECWLNKNNRYKVWHVNTWDVYHERPIHDDWTPQKRKQAIEFIEQEKKDMSALQFAQEYMGQFVDDLRQFFDDSLIVRAQTLKRPNGIAHSQTHALGVDIARMGDDESTFEILKKNRSGFLTHVESQISKKTRLTDTAKHIIQLNDQYDFQKIYLDDEGIGVGVLDMLIDEETTRRKTVALRNSKKVTDYHKHIWGKSEAAGKERMLKVDLYYNLLRLLEQGKIHLLDDPEVFQSLKSIQYEYTEDKKGKPFLKIFGNYSHICEGLVRAAWIAKEKNLSIPISYL